MNTDVKKEGSTLLHNTITNFDWFDLSAFGEPNGLPKMESNNSVRGY